MREGYRSGVDRIVSGLVHTSQLGATAVRNATRALLEADPALAEEVISEEVRVDAQVAVIEDRCFQLLYASGTRRPASR